MDLRFACTQCGKCCRDLKLPLTMAEAIDWLIDDHEIQIICDAETWPLEPSPIDRKAAHRRRRSFAAMSGNMPIRVTVILAGNLAGSCPNLMSDMRCGIYGRRPLVCRIYPAEINPFVALVPANKACPPEAWGTDRPLLQKNGQLIDDVVRSDIRRSRDTDAKDANDKAFLCADLGLTYAALANEGYVVYSPSQAALLALLRQATGTGERKVPRTTWQIVSNRPETVATIGNIGASTALIRVDETVSYQYLEFPRAS
jgi:Fe-S-cluster containining protein